MSKKKKDHAREESGFEDWGGYMAAKKTKLEEQFHNAVSKNFKESSKLFEGIAIFVNGYTDPTADELKRLMMMHGGVYHYYMRPKITTHIIATNLPYSKIMSYRKSQNPIPICKPQWVTDSITAGKILNFQNYLLYSNDINLQPQLTHKLSIKNGKFHIDPTTYDKQDTERLTASTNIFNDKNINSNVFNQDTTNNTLKHGKVNIAQCFNTRTNAQSTRNTEFLSAFYSNSRLHYIATMGMTFKDYVNRLRDKSDGIFLGLERLTKLIKVQNVSALAGYESDSKDDTIYFNSKLGQKQEPVIMHIDMDCFFVSVGIRKMPELQNLPVAVAHAKINTHFVNYDDKGEFGSLSEIASCSYEARKAGVKNGMFLGEALKICPNLKTIQYDFEGYKEVSYMLYDTVASYTLDIEAVSCDEMYANCTKILQTSSLSPMEFATVLRKEIKQKTGCPVSTGFGNNKLQARLATRKAKPDNQFYLSNVNAETYMRTFNVRDLPGVGGTTAHKLHEMNARTCEELQRISLATLQNEFGKKMGEQLYKMCRGLDDKKLNIEHVRKSVSAEVNYGIRFRNNEDAIDFLNKLATEVCSRLTIAHAKGRCITLKLMIRAEEAPKETAKFMGHGLCNYITRSKNLMTAVNDVNVIRREVINIWNQLHLTPEDMRGIGIQISRLEICRIKPNKGSLKNFFNKSKNEQTYEEAFVNNNSKDQCDSNFNISKVNSSEVPSISESSSLAMKNIFDTKIDNPLSISAQFSESITVVRNNEDTTIPFITQTKPVIFANETKNEILYHDKANENISCLIKTKDLSGKLKRIMQKQTSQENFYRHTKPSCGKSWKYEMPRIQDIDMSVLVELPQDIRNEILDEYKRNKEQPRIDTIDPDVLSALMEGNPHPDVQHDLQAHCGVRREANDKDIRVTSKKSDSSSQLGEQPRKSGQSSKICDNGEDVKTFVHNTSVQKTMRVLQENKTIQQRVKDNTDDILTMAHEKNQIEILYNNAAMDKADTFILQNLNILHNNENVDKHQEMLINLVNHLFTLPLQQAKLQIQTWVTKSNVVNEVDFLSLATFLSMLPRKKRIEDLHVLLKTMHRCTTKTGNCIWHRTYRRTVKHVQRYMQIEYNSNLMLRALGW